MMVAAEKRNLFQRIVAVIEESGALEKAGKTSYGEKYAYHKVDDVVAALRPLLVKHGVLYFPAVQSHATTPAGETRNGAMQWMVDLVLDLKFVNADDPQDVEVVTGIPGQGIDTGDKGAGKALSYALKNALLLIFQLRGQPDNEADNHERTAPASESESTPARRSQPRKNEKSAPAPDADKEERTERRRAVMREATKEGKWQLNAATWEEQVAHCQEEYGASFDALNEDQFGEFLRWISHGGLYPEGYKTLRQRREIAESIDEGLGPDTNPADDHDIPF